MNKLNERSSQQSIKNYFKIQEIVSRRDLKLSKRVAQAISKMSNEAGESGESSKEDGQLNEPKKRLKRTKSSAALEAGTSGAEQSKRRLQKTKSEADLKPSTSTEVKPKSKPRKRKNVPTQPEEDDSSYAKTPKIPEGNLPIPQREKDKAILEGNKLKAIEVMRKTRSQKGDRSKN